MFRNKSSDLRTLDRFIEVLDEFKREKMEKWEKVDDKVQSEIRLGSPSEDWIIPPDENITEEELMQDPSYRELKEEIRSLKNRVRDIAEFMDHGKINILDWLNFQNPLIGNVALDDCIDYAKKLQSEIEHSNYFKLNIKRIFS